MMLDTHHALSHQSERGALSLSPFLSSNLSLLFNLSPLFLALTFHLSHSPSLSLSLVLPPSVSLSSSLSLFIALYLALSLPPSNTQLFCLTLQ